MKRILTLALAALLVLCLCACGKDNGETPAATDPTKAGDKTPSTTPVGYTFTYNDYDYQFGVGMAAEGVLEKLGEPDTKLESESCAFGGMDTVYYYGSLQISTNDEDGYEKIYSIYLDYDLNGTEEGISVGNTADQVKDAYGEPGDASSENCLIYAKDGMYLKFILKDNKVSAITYTTLA